MARGQIFQVEMMEEISVATPSDLMNSCEVPEEPLIINSPEIPKMSKNQQKRLLKEAKRRETKAEWRKLQKTKRKMKEHLKREEFAAKGIFKVYCVLFYN